MADQWRNRARRAVETRLRDGLRTNENRPHYVVCGQNDLVVHLVNALLAESVRVTVIVPAHRRPEGPDIRATRGIRVVVAERLDEETFRSAGLVGADGLALMHQDDVGNIHAALCAQAVEPRLRLVLRMFNTGLGNSVRPLFADCAVLSDASMAAPTFVAAALGEPTPTHFRFRGRTLVVARRKDVRPEHVVCGLADTDDARHVRLLPSDQTTADLVLAEATGQPPGTEVAARRIIRARRRKQRPSAAIWRAVRSFATRKIGMATLAVVAVVVIFGSLLAHPEDGVSVWQAVYVALVTTISGADPDPAKAASEQVMQVVLNLAGLALIPLITAAVVDGMVNARLALDDGRLRSPRNGHVVVIGLGNVGTRVMAQLHDLGIEVVAIDKDPQARGASLARRLNVPLIVGDGAREENLEAASVATCQALVVVSTDDVTNLQAALNGRAIKNDLRVVLRLYDGDFADRIQNSFNMNISRSVSYLAAPSFAAALLNRQVIATIPIDRHALLVAEVPVAAGSSLVGRALAEVDQATGVRVIGLTPAGQPILNWSPAPAQRLAVGDQLVVVVRRAALSALLKQASPPQADPEPQVLPTQARFPTAGPG
ncbi:Trk K+ transport system NAD-binding subunit [Micromonospora pisi]|uniref:Trk K+ transport system NAD-binding subunit n=1 Tax=Micromonospora pisi TaxID=589240 RepID=A0A495JJX8_9ACTN|nr:NAD-binding protein [Micromonospora pisi]RKR88888.1 Trk K+ transport system NAD-binding subunit [Micromonospora pisi]